MVEVVGLSAEWRAMFFRSLTSTAFVREGNCGEQMAEGISHQTYPGPRKIPCYIKPHFMTHEYFQARLIHKLHKLHMLFRATP